MEHGGKREGQQGVLEAAVQTDGARGPAVHVFSMHTSPLQRPGSGDAGGMNVYISSLCRALARRGHRVEVFVLDTSAAPTPPRTDSPKERAPRNRQRRVTVQQAQGFRVHLVPVPGAEGAAKEDLPQFTAAFARACAAHAQGLGLVPDLLHAHYWLSGLAALDYRRLVAGTDLPLALTLHTSARSKNLQAGPGEPQEPEYRARAEEALVAAADLLVVNTEAEAEQMRRLCGADPARTAVIPPGTDPEVFHPGTQSAARRAVGSEEFRVLFAGRPQPLKGPEILLRALALARPRVPGLRLVMHGTASPAYLAALRELAERLGIAAACSFLPAAEPQELAQAFRDADLVACPSSSETFGLVALEAQACGTAVAGSDVSGLRAALDGGRAGVLVPERTADAWAQTIADLAEDPARRRRLGRAGAVHARTLTWDRAAERTAAAYRRLLERRGHRLPRATPSIASSSTAPSIAAPSIASSMTPDATPSTTARSTP